MWGAIRISPWVWVGGWEVWESSRRWEGDFSALYWWVVGVWGGGVRCIVLVGGWVGGRGQGLGASCWWVGGWVGGGRG